jgi:hypothetical protein
MRFWRSAQAELTMPWTQLAHRRPLSRFWRQSGKEGQGRTPRWHGGPPRNSPIRCLGRPECNSPVPTPLLWEPRRHRTRDRFPAFLGVGSVRRMSGPGCADAGLARLDHGDEGTARRRKRGDRRRHYRLADSGSGTGHDENAHGSGRSCPAGTRGLWHPIGPAYPGQGLLGRICR